MLRRGLHQRRLNEQLVRDIDETMEEYVCIPLTRLIRLVRRYVHHTKMKNIGIMRLCYLLSRFFFFALVVVIFVLSEFFLIHFTKIF